MSVHAIGLDECDRLDFLAEYRFHHSRSLVVVSLYIMFVESLLLAAAQVLL